jgi:hypothetical protein
MDELLLSAASSNVQIGYQADISIKLILFFLSRHAISVILHLFFTMTFVV